MDKITDQIAEFAAGVRYEDLPDDVHAAAKQRLIDAIGCALAARNGSPSQIAQRVAPRFTPDRGSGRVIGDDAPLTTMEAAAFANTVMIRYLDLNDAYPGGHPSDCLGAFLAAAESLQASGKQLLTAMAISYEVAGGITSSSGIRLRGWDQGLPLGMGTAAGMGSMLGLSATKIGHAIAITAASGAALGVTRTGQLSPWKGAATAYATRNAVFAALLADAGMAAPDAPFEGRKGVFDLITGPFELTLDGPDHAYVLPRTSLKLWPACNHLQPAIWAAIELREQAGPDCEFEAIDVATHTLAWKDTGNEPEKWDPRSRETADHSLPYVFARALMNGGITPADFDETAFLDDAMRPRMAKVRVTEDAAIESAYPADTVMHVRATEVGGTVRDVRIVNPKGHWKNPITDQDVSTKFTALAGPVIGVEHTRDALAQLWAIDECADLGPLLDTLRVSADS